MAESAEGPKIAGMQPLFELVLRHVAPPEVEQGPFRLLGTILEANPYLGRISSPAASALVLLRRTHPSRSSTAKAS